ncbi:hypothetical protein NPIL_623101, partial [Nephila pilipes]
MCGLQLKKRVANLSSSVEWIAGAIRGLVDKTINFAVDFYYSI